MAEIVSFAKIHDSNYIGVFVKLGNTRKMQENIFCLKIMREASGNWTNARKNKGRVRVFFCLRFCSP